MSEGNKQVAPLVLFAAVALLAAFFMPAIGNMSYGRITLNALERDPLDHFKLFMYVAFLAVAVMSGILELNRKGKTGMHFLYGGLTLFVWAFGSTGGFDNLDLIKEFRLYSVGWYLTALAGILYIVAGFAPKRDSG